MTAKEALKFAKESHAEVVDFKFCDPAGDLAALQHTPSAS